MQAFSYGYAWQRDDTLAAQYDARKANADGIGDDDSNGNGDGDGNGDDDSNGDNGGDGDVDVNSGSDGDGVLSFRRRTNSMQARNVWPSGAHLYDYVGSSNKENKNADAEADSSIETKTESANDADNDIVSANTSFDENAFGGRDKVTLDALYATMIAVSEAVTRGFSLAVGEQSDYLASFCGDGDTISLLRLFHYFPYARYEALTDVNDDDDDGTAKSGKEANSSTQETPRTRKVGSSPHTDW
jgi:hypothetical protein